MREAIGSSLLFNLIIFFVIIMLAFLVGSLAYSKAFKVKNIIINTIEKHQGYDSTSGSVFQNELNQALSNAGYRVGSGMDCDTISDEVELVNDAATYDYCVYRVATYEDGSDSASYYYKVITYMYFDIPIINQLFRIPVSGETKIIKDYNMEFSEE